VASTERPKWSAPAYATSLPAALQSLSEIIEAVSPEARLTVLSVRDDAFEVIASAGADQIPSGMTLRSPAMSEFRRKLLDSDPFVVSIDEAEIPDGVRDALRALGFKRALLAPLRSVGDVSECVVVDESGRCMEFGERERRLLSVVVSQARVTLDLVDLRIRAADNHRIIEAIARLGVVFNSVHDLKETAEQVVEYSSLLIDLPAFVLLFRPEGAEDFIVLAAEGLPSEVSMYTVTPIEVAALDVKRPGELAARTLPIGTPDSLLGYLKHVGMTNMLVAPLVIGGRLRGVLLGLGTRRLNPVEEERGAFQLLAQQATNAIWNAERHEAEVDARHEARQGLETTRLLLRAAGLLAESLDLDTMLQGLIEATVQATGRSRVVVSLYNAERDELVVQAAQGLDAMRPGTRVPLSDSLQMRASILEKCSCVIDHDIPSTSKNPVAAHAVALESRLALSVPLVFKGEAIGNVRIDEPGSRREFARREIEVVEGLASQAAVAIENARLFEAQRSVAEVLQQALVTLPEQVAGVRFGHAYHAASGKGNVGGDFYDIFELEHDRIGVIVGDISGKGLEAAVLTSLLKNTLRAHTAEPDKSPAAILRLTNEIVYKATTTVQFATVFFGILDCHDGRFVYSNAGHTTGAVVRADGSSRRLPANGPIVGAFPDLHFKEEEIHLDADEMLFLYTDGLTEARKEGREFGEERVFELLSTLGGVEPSAVIERVVGEFEVFTGGVRRDDLALFALQRLGV